MKQFRIFLCLLTICFAACGSDDTPEPTPSPTPTPTPVTEDERTVLVYMAAQNNLDNFAYSDLKEMKEGSKSLNDKQTLIVYTNISGEVPYFVRFKDGKAVDSVSVEKTTSSDPATLEEAVRYMRETYPSKSYGLILWGHCNGWLIKKDSIAYAKTRAYGIDQDANPQTWMNVPSMARAIKNGLNGKKFTFIHGDCCNFSNIEVAYELREVTDYIIGSPAEIPDDGADYTNLSGVFDTSSTFYKKMIDNYYDYYLEVIKKTPNKYYNINTGDLEGYSVPLLAIKTGELDNLASATVALLSTIPDKLKPSGTLDFSKSIFYAASNGLRYNYDMYKTLKVNTGETDFKAWEPAFEKAVPYYRLSPLWFSTVDTIRDEMPDFEAIKDDNRVLSMFFPNDTYQNVYPSWNKTIQQLQWNGPISWQQYGW